MNEPLSVYVHIPFCQHKCGYCDFNSYALSGEIVERTVRATIDEISRSPWRGRPARTVFFGGGTPSWLSPGQLSRLARTVFEAHPPLPGAEVSSEANPGSVDRDKFSALLDSGFNRVSLGVQSLDSDELRRLGRLHSADEAARAVDAARRVGLDNLSLDLMYGLPGQSPRSWERTLRVALQLGTPHMSLYNLTLESGTRFQKLHERGWLQLPSEEDQVEMCGLANSVCAEAGLLRYEISNWAKPGFECRHNLCYWRHQEYVGYGPGAVGCVAGEAGRKVRYTNARLPEEYCSRVESGAETWGEREEIGAETERFEELMLGLRLREGVPEGWVDATRAADLERKGWLRSEQGRVALTPLGWLFHNEAVLALS